MRGFRVWMEVYEKIKCAIVFRYQILLRSESAECGDAELHYYAIHHGNILSKMTSEIQTGETYNFFHDGFIDPTELERGFEYERKKLQHMGYFSDLIA